MTPNGDDWFKIIDSQDQGDSFAILKGLLDDFKKTRANAHRKAEIKSKKKKEKKTKMELMLSQKKFLEIVALDLVLEYRQVLNYMSKTSSLGPRKDKKERDRFFALAAHSMNYSTFLQGMIVKLGDKKGRIDLPYKVEVMDAKEMVRSHLYIERKVLAMYRKIKKEFTLDPWLREVLNYTIDAKAKNLENITRESRAFMK